MKPIRHVIPKLIRPCGLLILGIVFLLSCGAAIITYRPQELDVALAFQCGRIYSLADGLIGPGCGPLTRTYRLTPTFGLRKELEPQ